MSLHTNQRITLYINGKAHKATVSGIRNVRYFDMVCWIQFDDAPDKEEWYTVAEVERMMKNET